MLDLLEKIQRLKSSEIKNLIDTRLTEFNEIKPDSMDVIFKELCFCIMTANSSVAKYIEVYTSLLEINFMIDNLVFYRFVNKIKIISNFNNRNLKLIN